MFTANFIMSMCKTFIVLLLQKFEKKYNNELLKGAVSKETKFEYAWCLIRSKYSDDIKKGIVLLDGKSVAVGHKTILDGPRGDHQK